MATRANRLPSLPTLLKAQQGWYDDYVVLLPPSNTNGHPTNLCTQHLILTTTQTYRSNTMNIETKERLRLIAAEEIVKRITNEPDLSKDEAAVLDELPFQQRLRVELLRGNKQVLDSFIRWSLIDGGYRHNRAEQKRKQNLSYSKRTKAKEIGHVYFFESAGNFKIGKSCCEQIHKRVRHQRPDKVIAISEASNNYHKLEKDLHREYASKRMGRYEIFCGLTKVEIRKITEKLKSNWRLVEGINRDLERRKSLALAE